MVLLRIRIANFNAMHYISIDASSPTSVKDKKKHIGKLMAMLELLILFLWDFVVIVDEKAMPPQHCGH
jgi:hypothetical protein